MVRGLCRESATTICVLLCMCSVWIVHSQEGTGQGYKAWHLSIRASRGCDGTGECKWGDGDDGPYNADSDNGKAQDSQQSNNQGPPPQRSDQVSDNYRWQPAPPPPSSSSGRDQVEREGGEYWQVQNRRVRVALKEDVWKKPQSSTVHQQDYRYRQSREETAQPPSQTLPLPSYRVVSDDRSKETIVPLPSSTGGQTSTKRFGSKRRKFKKRYRWNRPEEQIDTDGDVPPRQTPQSRSGDSSSLPKSTSRPPQPPKPDPIAPPPPTQKPQEQKKQAVAKAWSNVDISRLLSIISGIEPIPEKTTTQPPTTTTPRPTTTPDPWLNPRGHEGKQPFALTWSEPTTPKPTPKPTTPRPTTPPPPPTTTLDPWLNPKRRRKRPFALRWSDIITTPPPTTTTTTPTTTTTTPTTTTTTPTTTTPTTTTTTPAPTTKPTIRPADVIPGLWNDLNFPHEEIELANGDKILKIIYIRHRTQDKPEDVPEPQGPSDEEGSQGTNDDSPNEAMAPPDDSVTADDGQMQSPPPVVSDNTASSPAQQSRTDRYASAWEDFVDSSAAEEDTNTSDETQPPVPDSPAMPPADMEEPPGEEVPKPEGEPQSSSSQSASMENPPAMASSPADSGNTMDSANLCADMRPTPMCTLAFPSCGGYVCDAQRFCQQVEANLTLLTSSSDKEYFRDAFSCVMEGVKNTHCTSCVSVEDALGVFLMDKDPSCNCLLQEMRLCDVLHEPRNQFFLLNVFVPFFSRSSFKADLTRTVLKATKYCPDQDTISVFRMLLMLSQS